jgi:glyoxylase-like metal-dependent hydrolase (beta-lactamase superfamily II)
MTEHARLTIDCEPQQPGYVASYLRVAGAECAFIETYTTHALPHMLAELARVGRRPEDVRYVVVTHAHLDHAGGASALLKACPKATLLAHPRAARHLIDPSKLVASATQVYGEEHFRKVYGTIDPIPEGRVRALEDGDAFELGDATLRVHHTAGHAKHHFVVDDETLDTVFTGDTFGLVYPQLQRSGLFVIASTSPTDFDGPAAHKSVDLVLKLGRKTVCPTHFGAVTHPEAVAEQLHRWIDRSMTWQADAAASGLDAAGMSQHIAHEIKDALLKAARAQHLGLSSEDWALLKLDVELNADGLAFAAQRTRTPKA